MKEELATLLEEKKEFVAPKFDKTPALTKEEKAAMSKEEKAAHAAAAKAKKEAEAKIKEEVKAKKTEVAERIEAIRDVIRSRVEAHKAELQANRKNNHLVLLARTEEGFYNIIKLSNDAAVNGFYYKPRMTHESLKQWGKGIIATSACYAGEISTLLLEDKTEEAKALYEFYKGCFDEFYVELTMVEMKDQIDLNRKLILFAKEVGAKMVVTCDSHYLLPEHAESHDLLLLIRDKKTRLDAVENPEDVWQFEARNLYHRNYEQIRSLWEDGFVNKHGEHFDYQDDVFTEEVFEEACANTRAVALSCQDIKLDSVLKLPVLYDDGPKTLREKVLEGFKSRGLSGKVYDDRLEHELNVIIKMGFADYFLTMDKIIRDTIERHGVNSVGWGRGSAAGSLVSYCLGLTDLDPIQYGLLFERFLDESRKDPPDIDTDFDSRIREQVKGRIVEMFGEQHTCSIGTYQTYKTRAVIVDVARAIGLDVFEANEVTKKMDSLATFDVEDDEGDISEMNIDSMDFDDVCKQYPELESYFKKYPEVRQHAEILRNQVKNMGKHAGGVIISNLNLQDRIPVVKTKDGVVSTWVEGQASHELSEVGLVKFDILGLNHLPVIDDALKLLEQHRGIKMNRQEIPINDRDAIKVGSHDDLVGIFQLDSPQTKPVVDAVQMDSIFDISAVTSLIRPGPKDMGMHMTYARRKHGEPYDMPEFLREQLSETHGVLTYQEDAMRASQVLSYFTPAESNMLRKAIGKKIPELMAEMKAKFIAGAQPRVDRGEITEEEVVQIFDLIESFAGYGFNRAHAMAYSAVSAAELWLKYNFPTEYMVALLNNTKPGKVTRDGRQYIVVYLNYARRVRIKVLPVDVNASKVGFCIENRAIRFSLSHVKNVGAAGELVMAGQPYANMEDFTSRDFKSKVNKRVVESLIFAGAFDSMYGSQPDIPSRRMSAFVDYFKMTGGKYEVPTLVTENEWVGKEKEVTQLSLSCTPLIEKYREKIKENKWCAIGDEGRREKCKVFGRVESVTPKTSKSGNPMFLVSLSDDIDSIEFYVFDRARKQFQKEIRIGCVAAIPMNKFEDGGKRFYDSQGESDIVEKVGGMR
jgi:DNA polymerase-3 subunit alpha